MLKRVLYVGNFRPSHSTENHIRKSLINLGIDVVAAQEDEVPIPKLDSLLGDVSLFLYTRTWTLQGADPFQWIARMTTPSVSFHLDLYAGLNRGAHLSRDPFWRTKYVFTPDGGSEAFFRSQGIQHYYLKPGVFDEECVLAAPAERYRADVTFVGSYHYHPEWPYRRRLVDFLRETYGSRFAKHGSPETCLRGEDLNALYASVKVVVGDSLCLGFDHPHYWSDRIYETLGRGGFLIHPYIFGLEEEFVDRKHVVFYRFGDFAMLRRLIDYYLKHDGEREAIRLEGHAHVKGNCTYRHRMHQMLETLSGNEPTLRGWV